MICLKETDLFYKKYIEWHEVYFNRAKNKKIMKITERTFLNASLRNQLSKRIEIFGEDYGLEKDTIENAVNQLTIRDEYFSNLIRKPHFSDKEIEKIIDINI